jgi:putative membrane protein
MCVYFPISIYSIKRFRLGKKEGLLPDDSNDISPALVEAWQGYSVKMIREPEQVCDMPQPSDGQSPSRYSRLTTQLANERTFLAWIRTGIALLAFGFVVEKAGTFLEAISAEVSEKQHNFVQYSGIAGVILMLSGAFIIGMATVRFWYIDRAIRQGRCETSVVLDIVVAVGITTIVLVFIVFLVFQSSVFS